MLWSQWRQRVRGFWLQALSAFVVCDSVVKKKILNSIWVIVTPGKYFREEQINHLPFTSLRSGPERDIREHTITVPTSSGKYFTNESVYKFSFFLLDTKSKTRNLSLIKERKTVKPNFHRCRIAKLRGREGILHGKRPPKKTWITATLDAAESVPKHPLLSRRWHLLESSVTSEEKRCGELRREDVAWPAVERKGKQHQTCANVIGNGEGGGGVRKERLSLYAWFGVSPLSQLQY